MFPLIDPDYDPKSYLNGEYPHPYNLMTDLMWICCHV